ncbi:MAG: transcription antitermination factor NusB [Lachnospiraceae bacterium]|nr:transcription antitermination factor NusB [Lachnospiraceae bacterium]MCD8125327.1 transcription antitermination factor NusB [Lachnospiraceae bacterium]
MTRREIREHIFKELFLAEFYDAEEYAGQCARYREDLEGVRDEEMTELAEKAVAVAAQIPRLDAAIDAVAEGWKTGRMGKVELTILRLALYEMEQDENVPLRVAINEAVELAKIYGGEDSPSFVNAILGKLARGMEA